MARKPASRRTTAPDAPVRAPDAPGLAAEAAAEEAFLSLDRSIHARIGATTGGLSPAALQAAWADWALHLALSPGKRAELGWKALRKWQRLMAMAVQDAAGGQGAQAIMPLPQDSRFAAPEWQRFPFNYWAQSFLLTQQWWHNATTGIHGVEARHEALVEFFSRQMMDMLAPSNFPLTNPQVLDRTLAEGGRNLLRGAGYLAEDVARAVSGGADPRNEAFRPGKAVAATEGRVVLRNRLIELIQYAPSTETVQSVPILIVPAWIMKYYILDLSAEHSLVRWLVGQGFTVFCISWKNPGAAERDLGFDDYRSLGIMAAIEAVGRVTGAARLHALGYCLGGTLLAVAAAAMAREGDDRLASITMLAAQVDFTEAGELSLFTSEAQLALLEDMMWQKGYLDKSSMAGTFNMLKSQDLIWSHMVHDYLMGERAGASDLAAWSQDATRMPFRMHSDYLRHLFLRNDLAEGRMSADGRPVFLEDISVPVFAVATERDHIAPWHSVFKLTHLLPGRVDFALVSGGHNTGIVAPPGSSRARYRLMHHEAGGRHPAAEEWAAAVAPVAGSWWEPWAAWLLAQTAAVRVPPPPLGGPDGLDLGPAPGKYVLKR